MGWFNDLFGGKKETTYSNTTSSGPDAASAEYIKRMREMSMNGADLALAGPGGANLGMGHPLAGGFMGPHGAGAGATGSPAAAGGSWFTGPQTMTPGQMAEPFMNPYIKNVIDSTRGEFDHMRAGALTSADQMATQSGAFGGSRHGVMAGARLGEIDRAQGTQISNLLNSGYQNALTQGVGFAEHNRQLRQQQMMEPLWRQQQAQQMMNLGMGPVGNTTTTSGSSTEAGGFGLGEMVGMGLTAYGAWQGAKGMQGGQPMGMPGQPVPGMPGGPQYPRMPAPGTGQAGRWG